MTKSNRHKRQRKQEKAKTQLTGVKKLSKAKNVVEPTLRVKKILIREQLKTSSIPTSSSDGTSAHGDDDSGGTKWKQSVQDLLVSTNHHNVNIRKDAIIGLQEVASSKSPQIIRNLDKLLGKIAALTSDQESIIRKENVKLAAMVISMISDEQLTPFWSMLIAHLKCTMTHLDLTVRYSALSFVELLVDHHPLLVYESSSVVLPCLLGLISTTRKSTTSDKNTPRQKNVTTLKTEITGKHDDITIRIKVVRLLSKCLEMSSVRIQEAAKGAAKREKSEIPSQHLILKYPFGYYGEYSNKNYVKMDFSNGSYTDRFYSTVTADPYTSSFDNDSSKNTLSVWKDFVNSCVPVLIETWVEIGPTAESSTVQSRNSQKGNRNSKQTGFSKLGNDKDSSANMGRRDGLHILNETQVESMLSIAILLEQLLQRNGIRENFRSGDPEEQSQLAKDIKNAHGSNVMKYFFGLMPYESVKETRRKDVIAINLKLFLIAGKLKMFDNFLKKKLQTFIEGVLRSSKLDENHCKMMLDAIRFLDMQNAGNLPTSFLISATKMGYHRIVTEFLNEVLHPSSYQLQKDKNLLDLVTTFEWDEVVNQIIRIWPVCPKLKPDDEAKHLFELLTFVALRKLADMYSIVRSCVPKLRELVTASEMQKVWETAHRAFVYADGEDFFASEFPNCETLAQVI